MGFLLIRSHLATNQPIDLKQTNFVKGKVRKTVGFLILILIMKN